MANLELIDRPDILVTEGIHFRGSNAISVVIELVKLVNSEYRIATDNNAYKDLLKSNFPNRKIIYAYDKMELMGLRHSYDKLLLLTEVHDSDIDYFHGEPIWVWTVAMPGEKHAPVVLDVPILHCKDGNVIGITHPKRR